MTTSPPAAPPSIVPLRYEPAFEVPEEDEAETTQSLIDWNRFRRKPTSCKTIGRSLAGRHRKCLETSVTY